MPSCTGVRPHDFDSTSSDSTWSQQTGPKELEVCVCVCAGVFFVFCFFKESFSESKQGLVLLFLSKTIVPCGNEAELR